MTVDQDAAVKIARLEERVDAVQSNIERIREDLHAQSKAIADLSKIAARGDGALRASLRWGGIMTLVFGAGYAFAKLIKPL